MGRGRSEFFFFFTLLTLPRSWLEINQDAASVEGLNLFSQSQFSEDAIVILNPSPMDMDFSEPAPAFDQYTQRFDIENAVPMGVLDPFNHTQVVEDVILISNSTMGFSEPAPVFGIPSAAPFEFQPEPQLGLDPSIIMCTAGCYMTFSRHPDRVRHEASVHGVNQQAFFCHVPGCSKGMGRGTPYKRQDKLTEHLWKKHANLGYRKRTP